MLVDPMLATGGSAVAAIAMLREAGAEDLRMICLVASPEGVRGSRRGPG
jgi:uracil phosphoribosyltransferase